MVSTLIITLSREAPQDDEPKEFSRVFLRLHPVQKFEWKLSDDDDRKSVNISQEKLVRPPSPVRHEIVKMMGNFEYFVVFNLN